MTVVLNHMALFEVADKYDMPELRNKAGRGYVETIKAYLTKIDKERLFEDVSF